MRQRLGETAGFVELDIDGIVFADKRGERRAIVRALVGADRHGAREPGQRVVAPVRQRLLDQLDAGLRAGGQIGARGVSRVPAFIGVDDQRRDRGGRAHRRDARRDRRRAAELDLEQRHGWLPGRRLAPWPRARRARS